VDKSTIGPLMKLRLPGWWPIFKWSSDGKYLAKINSSKKLAAKPKDLNKINLFEVLPIEDAEDDDQRLTIDKLGKSISCANLFNLELSPTDNILAFTTFATSDDQATVQLLQLPSKQQMRVQILGFDVKKAHLYWQSRGKYLAISMGHSQSKNNILIKDFSIGVVSVRDRNMPYSRTHSLGKLTFLAWEPDGDRFAVIHGGTKREEPSVTVFRVQCSGVDKGKCKQVLTLEKRRVNEVYWAPKGGRLVMANIDPRRRAGGEMEFVDIARAQQSVRTGTNKVETTERVHETVTMIAWDPSGRYLATATTMHIDTNSSGDDTRYMIWDYEGNKLFEHKIKYFYQFLWRPRPYALQTLSAGKRKSINNMLSQGWDLQFTDFDDKAKAVQINRKVIENGEKLKVYEKKMAELAKGAQRLREARAKLMGVQLGNEGEYTMKNVQQRLEKGGTQFNVSREVMKKILEADADSIVDYARWRDANM